MDAMIIKTLDRDYKIKYDEYGDVLYVVSDQSRVATRTYFDDADIQWRYYGDTERAAGFTVLDFRHVWSEREADLQSRISDHMGFSEQFAHTIVNAIYRVSAGGSKTVEQALERLVWR